MSAKRWAVAVLDGTVVAVNEQVQASYALFEWAVVTTVRDSAPLKASSRLKAFSWHSTRALADRSAKMLTRGGGGKVVVVPVFVTVVRPSVGQTYHVPQYGEGA